MKLDNFTSAAIRTGENVIPMMLIIEDGKEVYVMNVAQYQKTRRKYDLNIGPIHIHTFESVTADILAERAKRRSPIVDYFNQFDFTLHNIREEGRRRRYTQ